MLPRLSSDSSGGSGGGIRNSCGCSNNKGSSTSDGVKRVGCNSSGSNNNSTTSLHILTTAHTKRIVTRTAHIHILSCYTYTTYTYRSAYKKDS